MRGVISRITAVRAFRILFMLVFLAGPFLLGRTAVAAQDPTQTGDPVADAARKAREAKKSEPKPKKVFTNEDVVTKTAPEPPAPSNSAASQEATTTTSKPPAEVPDSAVAEKEDPNSEKAWRKRFATQRRKITDAQQELDVLQREAEKADVQYYSDPQKALKEQYSREEINAKNDKIAAKKKELTDLKQQLSDMEDELRRSGGDPGWAR